VFRDSANTISVQDLKNKKIRILFASVRGPVRDIMKHCALPSVVPFIGVRSKAMPRNSGICYGSGPRELLLRSPGRGLLRRGMSLTMVKDEEM